MVEFHEFGDGPPKYETIKFISINNKTYIVECERFEPLLIPRKWAYDSLFDKNHWVHIVYSPLSSMWRWFYTSNITGYMDDANVFIKYDK